MEQRFELELERYMRLPAEETTTDPFQWWKAHHANFPILSKLARKYLIITATSVPSERVFSTSGDVIVDTRCSLSGNNAEMLIFCAKNQKYMPMPL